MRGNPPVKKQLLLLLISASFFMLKASNLTGKVYDETSLLPVPGAEIVVLNRKTRSDDKGYYLIKNLENGVVIISVKADGFIQYATSLTIDDRRVRFDVPLKKIMPAAGQDKEFVPEPLRQIAEPQIQTHQQEQAVIPVQQTVQPVVSPTPATGRPVEKKPPVTASPFLENPPESITPAPGFKEQDTFQLGKKFLDEGNFTSSLPCFYQVMQLGRDLDLKIKAGYYSAIIFKNQSLPTLSLDYLYRTLALAVYTAEEKTFINQLKSEIASIYTRTGGSAFAKPIVEEILKDEQENFPVTNFNCYQFLSDWYQAKGNRQMTETYLKKSIAVNVSSDLKSQAFLSAIDLYLQREEYTEADRLLRQLKEFFQSQETEKREHLISALSTQQTLLQKGDIAGLRSTVIPKLEKALSIDPEYTQALVCLASLEFTSGKLTSSLDLVLSAKQHVKKLLAIDPEIKDNSGKKATDLLNEIETYLKGF
ncbi:MAG: hypothetical protein PHQ23_09205 [Candidatus Wallbacteria bacterium]|nr:hypothetical protein [Candidatus Wallbacteria bacterium]